MEGWLRCVCVSSCRLHVRAARRRSAGTLPLGPEFPDHALDAVSAEAEALRVQEFYDGLTDAVVALPPQQRVIAIARWMGAMSTADVARHLKVAPGTVKATLHHARAKLRAALDDAAA